MSHDLDAMDRRIVDMLVEDGRVPAARIARRLGFISERSTRYRIDRLLASGVLRISAIVNPSALGYHAIGDVIIEVAPGYLHDVAACLIELEQISYLAGSVGDGDLSIQVYARDTEQLVRFVNEVVCKVPGVTRTKTIFVPWKFKDVYDWRVPAEAAEGRRPTG